MYNVQHNTHFTALLWRFKSRVWNCCVHWKESRLWEGPSPGAAVGPWAACGVGWRVRLGEPPSLAVENPCICGIPGVGDDPLEQCRFEVKGQFKKFIYSPSAEAAMEEQQPWLSATPWLWASTRATKWQRMEQAEAQPPLQAPHQAHQVHQGMIQELYGMIRESHPLCILQGFIFQSVCYLIGTQKCFSIKWLNGLIP